MGSTDDCEAMRANESAPARQLADAELRAYVVAHVEEAVEKGWVRPYYQPVVRTLTGKLCGFEALARWEDPTYGTLSPVHFIPALEDGRAIHLVDCSIIRQVCKHYRERVRNFEPVVPVSFNLSRLDFELCDIFTEIERSVHEYGVPRHMLNIELTESVLGSNPEYMADMLRAVHKAGYQVWMDDFGSGYSTLNVLKDFDFDELKIDMEFLNRFGEKSKTIIASVVDMAKKLGIQTLAEGVETQEHREFLSSIGCEKMQGYLFGRPLPYNSEELAELYRTMGYEAVTEQPYLNEVGAVNTLSMSERDLASGNSTQDYVTSMPLAIVEYQDGLFKVIDSNRVFTESLANIGIDSVEEAERQINNPDIQVARHARRVIETIEHDDYARLDFVKNGIACIMRARHIVTQGTKTALLVSIDDTLELSERKRHDRMDDMLSVMYSIYEHVDIIHLDEGYIELVYGGIGLNAQFEAPGFENVTAHFANSEVYAADRERYLRFMDHDTMIERIERGGENYLIGFFRLRQRGGEYAWKLFALIHLKDQPGNLVMLCIRSTHWRHDGLFQAAFDENFAEGAGEDLGEDSDESSGAGPDEVSGEGAGEGLGAKLPDLSTANFTMTDGLLWRTFTRDSDMNLFWKDRNGAYIGASQAFLDYCGFDSPERIVGKTDAEMGWHIDPTPCENDDRRVLRKGVSIEGAPRQHIVRGEVRDVSVFKYPVYRNGRIIGLVGQLFDAKDNDVDGALGSIPIHDNVTNTLNYNGLEAATWRHVDTYKRQGIDFAMVSINIENFEAVNNAFGPTFVDAFLRRIGEELTAIAGLRHVVGHVYASRFVMLVQDSSDDELQAICDEIEHRLVSIAQVDGTPCTVYALAGYARFSKIGDVEAMKRYNRDRRLERRDAWSGSSAEDDVITSSLF